MMIIRIAMALFTVGIAVIGALEMIFDRKENRGH